MHWNLPHHSELCTLLSPTNKRPHSGHVTHEPRWAVGGNRTDRTTSVANSAKMKKTPRNTHTYTTKCLGFFSFFFSSLPHYTGGLDPREEKGALGKNKSPHSKVSATPGPFSHKTSQQLGTGESVNWLQDYWLLEIVSRTAVDL